MPNIRWMRSQVGDQLNSQGNLTSEVENLSEIGEIESEIVQSKMAENSFILHPEMIKALIPIYDDKTLTVNNWLLRVDQYAVIYGWKDDQKFLYSSTRLGGVPMLWYNSVCVSINTWKQFEEKIRIKFTKNLDAIDVHFQLMNIKKKVTESYVEFAYRVNEIAANSNVAEPSAVKYIIAALINDPIYNGIQNIRFNKLDELTNQFEYCEMMNTMTDSKKRIKFQTQSKHEEKSLNSLRCFKCNEHGHKKADCGSNVTNSNVIRKEDQNKVKISCTYCKFTGHTEDRFYKKQRDMKNEVAIVEDQINYNMRLDASLIIQKKVIQVEALFDTGSAVSMINELYLPLGMKIEQCNKNLVGINNTPIEVKGIVKAQLIINNNLLDIDLIVVRSGTMKNQILIGRDFVFENNLGLMLLDKFDNIVIASKEVGKLEFDLIQMKEVYSGVDENVLEVEEKDKVVSDDLDVGDSMETKELHGLVTDLFVNNFLSRQKPDLPIVKQEVIINLKSSKIFHATPMRYSLPEKVELNKIIEDLMQKEVIRESNSEYSSRVVLVKKKNNTYRMCINYRELNKLVERNHFPLPVIEDIIIKLKSMKYLGFISYFRKLIVGFNKQVCCLYDLMKQVGEYNFSRIHLADFNSLREALISKPVLSFYSPSAETQLHTDASARGYGAILMKKQNDENVITFMNELNSEVEERDLINIGEKAYQNLMNAQACNKKMYDKHYKTNTVYKEND